MRACSAVIKNISQECLTTQEHSHRFIKWRELNPDFSEDFLIWS